MKTFPIAMTTYTMREPLSADYEPTLARIAGIGYSAIEIGGFGPYSTAEWNRVLERLGLSILSNHIAIEMLEESFSHIIEFNRAIGNHRIVVPYLREERRQSAQDYLRVADSLNRIGRRCKENGFDLFYHNHAFEFTDFNGRTGMDILIGETDSSLVQFEVDTCWVRYGGADPAQFIRALKGRCQLIHLKDLEAGSQIVFREVGEGIVDFGSVLSACRDSEVEWLLVEQDTCPTDPFDCITTSLRNIDRLQGFSRNQKKEDLSR